MTKNRRVKVGVGVIGSQFAADLHAAVFQRSAGETAVVAVASPIVAMPRRPFRTKGVLRVAARLRRADLRARMTKPGAYAASHGETMLNETSRLRWLCWDHLC